jgi:hypothetical protein
MCSQYSNREDGTIGHGYVKHAFFYDGLEKLRNLIPLGKVRVEIVFSVETRDLANLSANA